MELCIRSQKSTSWVVPMLLEACCQANIVGMNDSKVEERTTTIRVEMS
jgi:hypothetical protein